MRFFKITAIAACLLLFCLSLALARTTAAAEKIVIEKVIRDNIGWALTKDRPLLESTMAHDERLFIFNPDSQSTVGWSQFVKGFDFWLDPRFKATKLDIWDMRIDMSRSGDVAWWACILDDLGEWDGKPIGWKDTRWTGVLEKRDGQWLIVQMHFSFASDKVAAEVKARLEAAKVGDEGKDTTAGRYVNVMSKSSYNYFLYLPKEYNRRPEYKWPLIVYLHGGDPRGDDLKNLQVYGIPYLIAVEKKEFPFVIVAPQCQKGLSWDREEWFEPFFARIKSEYRIDPRRVYLTGSSMGGTGTFYLAQKYPEIFAALAPMCGRIRELDLHRGARLIKHIPIWIFHGAQDRNVPLAESELMVKELKRYLGMVELTVFPDLGHANFTQEVYAKQFLYEWFLQHRQSDRYDNGQRKYQGVFRENKKQGKWIYWYSNGGKEREEEYVDGIDQGKWQYWDSRGKKCGEAEYVAGTGTRMEWYENGNKEREERFKNGKKNGKWFYWFENGKPEREMEYKDGLAHGALKGWLHSGVQEYDSNWFAGKPHGKYNTWYPSGNKKDEGNFIMGTGTVIRYDDNTGKKLVEQNYKDDKLHGKLIFWNRQGEVVSEEVYQDGKLFLKIK